MARSMVSLGIFIPRALAMAFRNAELESGSSLPPSFTATLISLMALVNSFARFLSCAPLRRLIFDHLLCPATIQILILGKDKDCMQMCRWRRCADARMCGCADLLIEKFMERSTGALLCFTAKARRRRRGR